MPEYPEMLAKVDPKESKRLAKEAAAYKEDIRNWNGARLGCGQAPHYSKSIIALTTPSW